MVFQRYPGDCGVACLAMICGVTYEDALVALSRPCPEIRTKGCWKKHLTQGAKALGFTLTTKRKFDLDGGDTGILNIVWKDLHAEHVVVLWDGRIIDTDGGLYMPDVYFAVNKARATALYVAEKQ